MSHMTRWSRRRLAIAGAAIAAAAALTAAPWRVVAQQAPPTTAPAAVSGIYGYPNSVDDIDKDELLCMEVKYWTTAGTSGGRDKLPSDQLAKVAAAEQSAWQSYMSDTSNDEAGGEKRMAFVRRIVAIVSPAQLAEARRAVEATLPEMQEYCIESDRRTNPHQICLGLAAYREDHQGAFPPNLGDLIVLRGMSPEMFLTRGSHHSVPTGWDTWTPDQRVAWVNENSDYAYIRPTQKEPAPKTVVCYEKEGCRLPKKVAVLYSEGNEDLLPADDALRQIAAANQGVAK